MSGNNNMKTDGEKSSNPFNRPHREVGAGGSLAKPVVVLTTSLSVYELVDRMTHAARTVPGFVLRRSALQLDDAIALELSNPAASRALDELAPSIASEMPMKLLVRRRDGQTLLSYRDVKSIAVAHGIDQGDPLVVLLDSALRGLARVAEGDPRPRGRSKHSSPFVPTLV